MLNNPNIFIIVPAYNEEKNLESVLSQLSKEYHNIILVDDASTDHTAQIAKKFPITLLQHKINRGQGASLETGNQYAFNNGADIIVHFDADGQFLVKEIKDIIQPIIQENYDVVLGSRFLEKKSKMPWLKKNLLFPIARLVNKIFGGINLKDPQNGFRAFQAQLTPKLRMHQDGSAHCSEFLYQVFKNKLKIKEVAVTINYQKFGQGLFNGNGRGTGGLKIIKDLIFKK